MGQVRVPPRVKYFIGVLSAAPNLLDDIYDFLEDKFGKVEEAGPTHIWDFSPAYTKELGNNIQRRFFVFQNLANSEDLPDWKLASNELEKQFGVTEKSEHQRRINIDPGYLNASQIIMASTKRYANRVYLRDGIYADLTLYFNGRSFRPLANLTLPDYRTRSTIKFFNRIRKVYLKQVKTV